MDAGRRRRRASTVELLASRQPGADEMDAYERVLGDAMDGDATLFAREDYVEEAWRIVDPVLRAGHAGLRLRAGHVGPARSADGSRRRAAGTTRSTDEQLTRFAESPAACRSTSSPMPMRSRSARRNSSPRRRAPRSPRAGAFTFAVSGGRTPWQMLRALAARRRALDRTSTCSRSTSASRRRAIPTAISRTSRESLLAHVPLPPDNVHAMPVEATDLARPPRSYAQDARDDRRHTAGARPRAPGPRPRRPHRVAGARRSRCSTDRLRRRRADRSLPGPPPHDADVSGARSRALRAVAWSPAAEKVADARRAARRRPHPFPRAASPASARWSSPMRPRPARAALTGTTESPWPQPRTSTTLCINTIRTLSIDAVQAANSGHPGTPMALAPLVVHAVEPRDALRSRRIRSGPIATASCCRTATRRCCCGRCCTSPASQAVNADYEALGQPVGDARRHPRFRQLGSKAPGHPEYHLVSGVETTTGPLGQGIATSVGMAIAQTLAREPLQPARTSTIFDYNIYAVCGDGCLMEGVGSEAASLAGHLELDNLCWIYDNNHITIEGNTQHRVHRGRRRALPRLRLERAARRRRQRHRAHRARAAGVSRRPRAGRR